MILLLIDARSLSVKSFTLISKLIPASIKILLDSVGPIPYTYVRAVSILFSLGMSTPAILAIILFILASAYVLDFSCK
ncbi:MAG: hypothetical protein ACD_24C00137G0005 [uncultured bacterium]|nr:MAG: hypothetical protein ACD_24C00137G0005 [uncultured bacterium]